MVTPSTPPTRNRLSDDRLDEIFEATLHVLAESGYDRMTLDAVAQRAHTSKATLYRRWQGKLPLVIDSLRSIKGMSTIPDTGSLREDLLTAYCSPGGLTDPAIIGSFGSVVSVLSRDDELATSFRAALVEPKAQDTLRIFERARDRGEISPDVPLDVICQAIAAVVLHRHLVLGAASDRDIVARIVDELVLPALRSTSSLQDSHRPSERSR
jgi:AcrR family transcriptional regulator